MTIQPYNFEINMTILQFNGETNEIVNDQKKYKLINAFTKKLRNYVIK